MLPVTPQFSSLDSSVCSPSPDPLPLSPALPSAAPTLTSSHSLPSPGSLDPLLYSVVKIFCTSTFPFYSQPWSMKRQSASTCSGFLIDCHRRWILTNAHGVTSASQIRIRKHGDAVKYPGKIVQIAHECDLAILSVDDPRFWLGAAAMQFGDVPQLLQEVTVIGFPTGGEHLSISSGVVSRVMMATYSHSGEVLLAIQVDAPINPGNSGGPAVQNSKVVGVAFESLTQAQSIGYIIPTPVIQHFLTDLIRNERYTGWPRLAIQWQRLENDSLKRFLKLPESQNNGIVVSFIEPLDPCAKVLQKDDVIVKIDGMDLGEDGTVLFRKGERVSFRYVESLKYVGDSVEFEIIRQGKTLSVQSTLAAVPSLVPLHLHDQMPQYLIYAGLVFTPLSRAYLYHEWGSSWNQKAPVDLVAASFHSFMREPGQQVILLSQILVHDVNAGYTSNYHNLPVISVNGQKVKNLPEMALLMAKLERDGVEFFRFELEREAFIVIEAKAAKEAEQNILAMNSIAQAKSADIREHINKMLETEENEKTKTESQATTEQ